MLAASVASTALAGGSPSTIGRRALLAGAGSSAALLGTPPASHAAASVRGTSWYADEVDGVPASLDPSRWQIDARQFKEYDRSRAVLFDTRVGSYLPAAPARYIQAALHRDGDPRVIFAGETHTHPLHHLMQYELVRGVNDLDGKPLAIGLEMCYRQHQPALDAFVFGGGADGGGSFSELKKRVKWRKTWGYDINQYAKIFSYARQNGIRLVGLNVPYGMVQMVSNFGLRKLPDELRGCVGAIPTAQFGAQFSARNSLTPSYPTVSLRYLPEMDLSNEKHYARFEREMLSSAAHSTIGGGPNGGGGGDAGPVGMTKGQLYKYYQAQTLWDEYMAESAAKYMDSHPDSRLVVLAGASHVASRDGVPDRYTRRTGGSTFTVLPKSVPWTTEGLPAIERPADASEADWMLYTQPEVRTGLNAASVRERQKAAVLVGRKERVSSSSIRSPVVEL